MALDALDEKSISGERLDLSVYHYHPPLVQVHAWLNQAGFTIEEEGTGDEYAHLLTRKKV